MTFLINELPAPDGGSITVEDIDVRGGKRGQSAPTRYRIFTRRDKNGEEVDAIAYDGSGKQIVGSKNRRHRGKFRRIY